MAKKSILKKFNWAAFLFCPIWAVAHEVKEGYWGFVPGFWTIVGIYLGCCGNELAYESQNWKYTCEKDLEEREKKWYRVIYVLLLCIFMIFLLFKVKDAYIVYRNDKIYEENYQRGLDLKEDSIKQTLKLINSDVFKKKEKEIVYEYYGITYTFNLEKTKDKINVNIENFSDYEDYKDLSKDYKLDVKLSKDINISKTTIVMKGQTEEGVDDSGGYELNGDEPYNYYYWAFYFEDNKLSYAELIRVYKAKGDMKKERVIDKITKNQVSKVIK